MARSISRAAFQGCTFCVGRQKLGAKTRALGDKVVDDWSNAQPYASGITSHNRMLPCSVGAWLMIVFGMMTIAVSSCSYGVHIRYLEDGQAKTVRSTLLRRNLPTELFGGGIKACPWLRNAKYERPRQEWGLDEMKGHARHQFSIHAPVPTARENHPI